jgi:hypothetical protein
MKSSEEPPEIRFPEALLPFPVFLEEILFQPLEVPHFRSYYAMESSEKSTKVVPRKVAKAQEKLRLELTRLFPKGWLCQRLRVILFFRRLKQFHRKISQEKQNAKRHPDYYGQPNRKNIRTADCS